MEARTTPGGFVVRLDRGDEVISVLTEFAKDREIQAATLTGIGALENVTLGFFHRDRTEYEQRLFKGEY